MLGMLDSIALSASRVAPTILPHKRGFLVNNTQWCSVGIQNVSNTLSTSTALCNVANLALSVPSIKPHYHFPPSLGELHANRILKALFIHQQSGKMSAFVCVCICACCERAHSRGTPCLFYYSYSCVDPLSARRHLPEIHTAHTDVLAIFSFPPLSCCCTVALNWDPL